jgi:hypothetical protein
MDSNKKMSLGVFLALFLYVVAGFVTWLWVSLSIVTPWLVSLGAIQWLATVISLVGIGFVTFWVFWFIGIIVIAAILI